MLGGWLDGGCEVKYVSEGMGGGGIGELVVCKYG